MKVCQWLEHNQTEDGTWISPTQMKKFGLFKPFPSAMVQGLAMSCLCRAYHLTGQNDLLDKAGNALDCFQVDVADGGVTTHHDDYVFYEEYPSPRPHHVLNGFIYALWGLHDLARCGVQKAQEFYNQGLRTLAAWLPKYDMGYWSLYHLSDGLKNPATVHYHRLHIDQLDVIYQLSHEDIFLNYRDRWRGYLSGRLNAVRTLPHKLVWRAFYRP
jgi:hypothetical protein